MNDKIFEGYRGSTPPYLDITQLRIKPLLEKKWPITQRRGKRNWCIRKGKRDCHECKRYNKGNRFKRKWHLKFAK